MKLYSTLATLAVALSPAATFADHHNADTPASADAALAAVLAGDWRSADDKSRDKYRHPGEALGFWGLAPGMTVLEIQPGGGWWTEILAPYAQRTGGRFYATAVDLSNPEVPEAARKSRAEFEQRYAAKPDVYGKIELVNWGLKSAPLPAEHLRLHPDRALGAWLDTQPRHGREGVQGLRRRTQAGRNPGGRAAPREPRSAGHEGRERLRHRSVRDRAGREGGAQARRALRDQRQPEGHQGSSVRRLDVAADACARRPMATMRPIPRSITRSTSRSERATA